MTVEVAAGLAADFASLPSWTLNEGQLGDLELLLTGAFAPLTGFMGVAEVSSVSERGVLTDGTPWPVPVTLDVPEGAVAPTTRRLALNDPEGVPLAVLDITERSLLPYSEGGRHARAGSAMVTLSGPVSSFREPEHGPFRQLRRHPAELRQELGGDPVLAFATRR
ncbi:MAG TPA: adenylyl-sulfate kinase, partial [Streptosporangiaceae bacterium]